MADVKGAFYTDESLRALSHYNQRLDGYINLFRNLKEAIFKKMSSIGDSVDHSKSGTSPKKLEAVQGLLSLLGGAADGQPAAADEPGCSAPSREDRYRF